MRRIEPYFPPSRGGPRVDDRPVISATSVIRNGFGGAMRRRVWAAKTIYNRFSCWRRLGVLNRIFRRGWPRAASRTS